MSLLRRIFDLLTFRRERTLRALLAAARDVEDAAWRCADEHRRYADHIALVRARIESGSR